MEDYLILSALTVGTLLKTLLTNAYLHKFYVIKTKVLGKITIINLQKTLFIKDPLYSYWRAYVPNEVGNQDRYQLDFLTVWLLAPTLDTKFLLTPWSLEVLPCLACLYVGG